MECKNVLRASVKIVLSGHLKIDKTKVLMEKSSLMKVKSIAECCNTFDLHYAIISIQHQFWCSF